MITLISILVFLFVITKNSKSLDLNSISGCISVVVVGMMIAVIDVDNKNPEVQIVRSFIIENLI